MSSVWRVRARSEGGGEAGVRARARTRTRVRGGVREVVVWTARHGEDGTALQTSADLCFDLVGHFEDFFFGYLEWKEISEFQFEIRNSYEV